MIFSFVFYMVFARFREQACVLACPYGRMLSALTDARTITITYDWRRGEPRNRLVRGARGAAGDCIDCHQCVTVCPTGIDIRDGIQLECVNCTACIDACNGVMAARRPPAGAHTPHVSPRHRDCRRGSDGAFDGARQRRPASSCRGWRVRVKNALSARVVAYTGVWLILAVSVAVLLAGRRDLDVLILRQPGTLYTTITGGDVANFYTVQALNRTGRAAGIHDRSRGTARRDHLEPGRSSAMSPPTGWRKAASCCASGLATSRGRPRRFSSPCAPMTASCRQSNRRSWVQPNGSE